MSRSNPMTPTTTREHEACRHRRCGNREWHHATDDGSFGPECEPFTLSPGECECREPAVYGTLPDPKCTTCGGTGYTTPTTKGRR